MNCKGFHHLTWNDRLTIEKLLKIKTPKAKIAEALGVSERTIYYEIKRGMCVQQTTDYIFEERYCPEVAERAYRENLKAKGPDLKIGSNKDLADFIEEQIIVHHYSPGAALCAGKGKFPNCLSHRLRILLLWREWHWATFSNLRHSQCR